MARANRESVHEGCAVHRISGPYPWSSERKHLCWPCKFESNRKKHLLLVSNKFGFSKCGLGHFEQRPLPISPVTQWSILRSFVSESPECGLGEDEGSACV